MESKEYVMEHKAELANKLMLELKKELNREDIIVGHGMSLNVDNKWDFSFRLQLLDEEKIPKNIVDIVEKIIYKLEPTSIPDIKVLLKIAVF